MRLKLGYNFMREDREQKFRESKILEMRPIAEGELWAAHRKILSSREVALVLRLLREELETRTSLWGAHGFAFQKEQFLGPMMQCSLAKRSKDSP